MKQFVYTVIYLLFNPWISDMVHAYWLHGKSFQSFLWLEGQNSNNTNLSLISCASCKKKPISLGPKYLYDFTPIPSPQKTNKTKQQQNTAEVERWLQERIHTEWKSSNDEVPRLVTDFEKSLLSSFTYKPISLRCWRIFLLCNLYSF